MRKILVVIDSYSDAILMAPLVRRLRLEPSLQPLIYLAAQPRERAAQVLNALGVLADECLDPTQDAARAPSIDQAILRYRPDFVLVYGNGAASIASFRLSVPAGNVDAGLRMYELRHAEVGEVDGVIDPVSRRFFVTSEAALDNLLRLGVSGAEIYLTGDLAIDALRMAVEQVRDKPLGTELAASFPFVGSGKRLMLVVGHRREDCGGGLEGVCRALRRLAARPDVHVAYPLPPSPMARSVVEGAFLNHPGVTLMEPQDYLHWVYLMQAAYLILADSGDTPKEALALGKPVLVMRDAAERPEVVDSGAIKLVGTDAERILRECTMFLDDPAYYRAFSSARTPYGDGLASQRIVETLLR